MAARPELTVARVTRTAMGETSPIVLRTVTPAGVLDEARERTLAIVAPYGDHDMERVTNPLMSPLVWDLAHIAAYEDLWLNHRLGGLPLLRPELAALYDAFETPRDVRGDLPLLDRAQAEQYLADVRGRAHDVLDSEGPGGGEAASRLDRSLILELVLRHEHQHNETMLQAIELAGLGAPGVPPHAARLQARRDGRFARSLSGLEPVDVPGGRCRIGAAPDGFAYDNERPWHAVDVRDFRIGRAAITNATYLNFVEGGGYRRREWWTDEAWHWKEEYDITHPGSWVRGPDGDWRIRRIDGETPLDPDAPVVHVSWFEADAFARAHGARLPTEAEWEKAATWDQATSTARRFPWGDEPPPAGDHRANLDHGGLGPLPAGSHPGGAAPCGALGMLGDTWEWTSSRFTGYPGFEPFPYREYSEVFFGSGYYVLRGGSWASRAHVITPTFRNWDLPQRRQIFAGVRLAWTT
ncbi:MAG: gamma-glutamyl hercynylcysteine S-oxide synthase [Solirubrobacteraceae bacterium]|nr:gamma-glutamyl hercynylcysteine S-oxide synthase [Solirubrobacteraceae bacterium]